MIVKCNRTGKILFSTEEASKHAEEVGFQDFTEVAADQRIFVDAESKRRVFWSQDEVTRFKQRTRQPDFQVTEITVSEYGSVLADHQSKFANDEKVVNYAKKKIVDALVEVKGKGVRVAEKACWFTSNKGIAEAEAWIEAHKDDPDFDQPLRITADTPLPEGVDANMDAGDAAGDFPAPPPIEYDPDATENGAWLKEKINQNILQDLLAMGFAQIRAEKALHFTDSVSIDHAVNWLGEHENDPDIDKAITKEPPAPPAQPEKKPKLSPEEAARAAKELQEKLRREREAREKQENKDKEKARIESQKMMRETQAQLDEEQLRRDREARDREKRVHDEEAAKLKEQLRLDYIERFGKEPPAEEEEKAKVKTMTNKQLVIHWINQLKKNHAATNREGLKVCFKTVRTYAENAKNNSIDPKYHKIKKANKAFQERVAPFPEAHELLRAMGFKDEADPEFFAIVGSTADGWLLGEGVKFIDLTVGSL